MDRPELGEVVKDIEWRMQMGVRVGASIASFLIFAITDLWRVH
jgi:hypothetical protein